MAERIDDRRKPYSTAIFKQEIFGAGDPKALAVAYEEARIEKEEAEKAAAGEDDDEEADEEISMTSSVQDAAPQEMAKEPLPEPEIEEDEDDDLSIL